MLTPLPLSVELDLCGFQLNRHLAKLCRLFPQLLGASDRQSQKREVVGVMFVTFERPAQSYHRLLGVFVPEDLDAFPELRHSIELSCARGSLFGNSEVHGGSLGNQSGLRTNLVRSLLRSLLVSRSVLTNYTKDPGFLWGSRARWILPRPGGMHSDASAPRGSQRFLISRVLALLPRTCRRRRSRRSSDRPCEPDLRQRRHWGLGRLFPILVPGRRWARWNAR